MTRDLEICVAFLKNRWIINISHLSTNVPQRMVTPPPTGWQTSTASEARQEDCNSSMMIIIMTVIIIVDQRPCRWMFESKSNPIKWLLLNFFVVFSVFFSFCLSPQRGYFVVRIHLSAWSICWLLGHTAKETHQQWQSKSGTRGGWSSRRWCDTIIIK